VRQYRDLLFLSSRISVRAGPTPGTRLLFKLTRSFFPANLSPSPRVLHRRTSPLSRTYPVHNPKPRNLPFFLALLRSPVRTRTDSGAARFLSSSSVPRKGLPLWNRSKRDICSTPPFHPRRFRPGPVPQRTQGLQASAKGTTSCVFTGPSTSTPTRDLFLCCQ